jgi:hypothetical protein
MFESQDCLRSRLTHKSSERIIAEYSDEFVANALWCHLNDCKFLKAYIPYGIVADRGTCKLTGKEYSDSVIEQEQQNSDRRAEVPDEAPSQLALPNTGSKSIHDQAREAATSAAFDTGNLGDDLIGHKGSRSANGLKWMWLGQR